MKTHQKIMRILAATWLLSVMPTGQAEGLDPYKYVAVEAEVRGLTLDGMAARVALLSSASSTPEQEATLDAANREEIARAYRDNGTTPSAHAAYGTRHAEEIAAWLSANPAWQQHLDDLASEFDSLLNQLDGLTGGQ
jgi:hypothetical protein